MNITVKRRPSTAHCTIGDMYIDGTWECVTLEDVIREVKIQNETAIPAGRYRVIINHSAHFGRDLPLLLKVPNFEGVRIHPGNTDKDTEGCILVGKRVALDAIVESRMAFGPVFEAIKEALDNGEEVWITLENP